MRLSAEPPHPAEAVALRAQAGWGAIDVDRMAAALDASHAHMTARDADGQLVGMARVVGDGVLNLYIQDVIVRPDQRGQGIARAMLADLLERLRAAADPMTTIGLLSVAGLEPFYASFGFVQRPDGRYGAGMMLFTP